MALADKIGGGFKTNSVQDQSQWAMDTLKRDYPQLMQLLNSAVADQAQAELGAARAVTSGYNDLAMSEAERLAPGIAKVQGQMDAGQAAADVANLNAYGQQAGAAMRSTDAAANPEYYRTLEGLGGKFTQLLNEASPTLTAGQRASVERDMARLNPQGADNSAVSTAEKAMNFGQARQENVNRFGDILQSVSAALPAIKTGLNPVGVALGRDSRNSPVAGAMTPVTKPNSTAYQLGGQNFGGLLDAAVANENRRAGKFKTWGDTLEQDSRSFQNIASGASSIAGIGM